MDEIRSDSLTDSKLIWQETVVEDQIAVEPMVRFSSHTIASECQHDGLLLILPSILKIQMLDHASREVTREQMGIILGQPYRDPTGFFYLVVRAAIPAMETEADITRVRLHAHGWPSLWKEAANHEGQGVVGWYHSHPGYGIFLSATDKKTQEIYFSAKWQIAIVIDPVREEFGVFSGVAAEQLPDSNILLG